MNIPSRIKIGGIEYKVVTVRDVHMGNAKCNGVINFSSDVIELDSKLTPQRREETFLHEVIHAIAEFGTLDFGENDEHVTETFAKGFHAFIKQNPKVFCNK